jgi:hypothetical protein
LKPIGVTEVCRSVTDTADGEEKLSLIWEELAEDEKLSLIWEMSPASPPRHERCTSVEMSAREPGASSTITAERTAAAGGASDSPSKYRTIETA